ncbi:MAG TPA: hypothetical protein VKU85_01295 [bacterium]|nr:hypothetical protein [bacterium]
MMRALRIGRTAAVLAIGLGVLVGAPLPGQAQIRDRLGEQLQTTDDVLDRARDVVAESDSQRAREHLARAAQIQLRAWGEYRAQRGAIAARMTMEARQGALRALDLAREDSGLRSRAVREIEKAKRALDLARESFDGAPGEQTRRLLEEARLQAERARIQLNEQHYEVAIRLAVSAQSLVRQAAGAGGDVGGDRVRRELERTDNLIERVRSSVHESGDGEAGVLLERGVALQSEAQEAHRNGRLAAAFTMTRQARSLVNRAALLAHGPLDDDSVSRALDETERVLDTAAEIVASSSSDVAGKLLERAREHQVRAHDLAERDELRASLAETRVARSLAKRALQLAREGGI